MPDRLRGVEWTRLPTSRHLVALSFDGGANADGLPSILTTLRSRAVPATFFLTGRWARTYPGLARSVAERFALGNHTISHAHLPSLTDPEIVHEVRGGGRQIAAVTGVDTRPLFRFPYGDSSRRALSLVNSLGFASIRWTVDTLGWEGASAGITRVSILRRVIADLQPGEIVLMHVGSSPDGSTLDADALPRLISELHSRGYDFTTIDRFTGRPSPPPSG